MIKNRCNFPTGKAKVNLIKNQRKITPNAFQKLKKCKKVCFKVSKLISIKRIRQINKATIYQIGIQSNKCLSNRDKY